MNKFIVLFVVLATANILVVNGQACQAPDGLRGSCQSFPRCPALLQLYNTNRNNNRVIQFLSQAQRSCGGRVDNARNPIVCCAGQQQQQPQTTTTTTTTTTTPASVARGPACTDPFGVRGACQGIKDCPVILQEFLARNKEPDYVQYIQNSNARCNYAHQQVCCPTSGGSGASGNQPVTSAPVQTGGNGPWPLGNPNNYPTKLLTPYEGCGYSNETTNRVVGGVPAKRGAYPWMALIGYKNDIGEISYKCGGSIITKKHVLTAAHCLRADLNSVRLGEHDTDIPDDTEIIDIPVVRTFQQPNYDKKDGHSDMAILVLGREIPFTLYISPICLPIEEPIKSRDFEGYMPFVAGWGRTQEGGQPASILQELQLPVLPNSECQERYKAINKLISAKQFDKAVLCAGFLEGGKDSCQGDSGGPLMSPSQTGGQFIFYQIGVVSYGIGCARQNVPGVYSSVQFFVDWIQQKVAESA